MSTHRDSRFTRRDAEAVLSEVTATAPVLDDILAAVSAPPTADELAAEHSVIAEFRVARLTPAPHPRRPSMIKTLVTKLLAAKIATVATIAVASTGGAALAAETGSLPAPLQHAAHTMFGAPAADSPRATPTEPATSPTDLPTQIESDPGTEVSDSSSAPGDAANGTATPSEDNTASDQPGGSSDGSGQPGQDNSSNGSGSGSGDSSPGNGDQHGGPTAGSPSDSEDHGSGQPSQTDNGGSSSAGGGSGGPSSGHGDNGGVSPSSDAPTASPTETSGHH